MLQPAPFPLNRPRRLRQAPWMRALVAETRLAASDLIWPCFVIEGDDRAEPLASMPGVERLTVDRIAVRATEAPALGVPAIGLFTYTNMARRAEGCEGAWDPG
ncbi:MAG: porphobilinogen synthase, partial [Paracoccaceae bacterium]